MSKHSDRTGRDLQVGDIVHVPCRVERLYDEDHACNLRLETLEVLVKDGETTTLLALNARQVEWVGAAELEKRLGLDAEPKTKGDGEP